MSAQFQPYFSLNLLHHGAADGLAADVHGDEAGSEEGAVLVAVDLLEDQPQHRGVDDALVLFLYLGASLAAEIVGVQKFEEDS